MVYDDSGVMQMAQEVVASFDVHYGLPAVCGNCVFLGQIQVIGET